jgi:predicted acetyltransferase
MAARVSAEGSMVDDGFAIRSARADEAEETLGVLCAAFQLPLNAARPIFYGDPFYDLSHKRILRTPHDGIVSCFTVVPTQIRIGNAWVPMAGIAGVATLPQFQKQGCAGRLLAGSLPALADELGYPIAGLFAESEALYRQWGAETVTGAACRTMALPAAPALRGAQYVRLSDTADREGSEAVCRIHAAAHPRTGQFCREGRRWRLIEMVEGRRRILFQRPQDPISGYAYWEQNGDTVSLLEIVGPSEEAMEGLAAYVQQQPAQRLVWPTAPRMMLRIVDVSRALNAVWGENLAPLLADADAALTLHVLDPLRPENNLPVRLTPHGVERGQKDDRNAITLGIRAFAQIYFGFQISSEAAPAGELTASSPAALMLADTLFPRREAFISPLDHF